MNLTHPSLIATSTNAEWRFCYDHPWILATEDGLYEARFSDERCAIRSAASRGDGRYVYHERDGTVRSQRECVTMANALARLRRMVIL